MLLRVQNDKSSAFTQTVALKLRQIEPNEIRTISDCFGLAHTTLNKHRKNNHNVRIYTYVCVITRSNKSTHATTHPNACKIHFLDRRCDTSHVCMVTPCNARMLTWIQPLPCWRVMCHCVTSEAHVVHTYTHVRTHTQLHTYSCLLSTYSLDCQLITSWPHNSTTHLVANLMKTSCYSIHPPLLSTVSPWLPLLQW